MGIHPLPLPSWVYILYPLITLLLLRRTDELTDVDIKRVSIDV